MMASNATCLIFSLFVFICAAKELVPSNVWQKVHENDTLPAEMYVKIDLSTGEKWAKIANDNEDTNSGVEVKDL